MAKFPLDRRFFVVLSVIGASSFANDYSQTFEFKGTITPASCCNEWRQIRMMKKQT